MTLRYPTQRFAVIGLGRFGSRLAANLTAAGQEVVAIDKNEKVVQQMRDRVTLAVCLDATDESALRAQEIDQVDTAIVGIGAHFQAKVLATLTLKQLGVAKVISRAVNLVETRVMQRIGADEVVNPEDESADRWAIGLANPWFLGRFELDASHSIVEIHTPDQWVGKTLAGLQLRKEFGVNIVAVRSASEPDSKTASLTRSVMRIPLPDQSLKAQDVLVVMGRDTDLARVGDL